MNLWDPGRAVSGVEVASWRRSAIASSGTIDTGRVRVVLVQQSEEVVAWGQATWEM